MCFSWCARRVELGSRSAGSGDPGESGDFTDCGVSACSSCANDNDECGDLDPPDFALVRFNGPAMTGGGSMFPVRDVADTGADRSLLWYDVRRDTSLSLSDMAGPR